jgi:hypothetical protein
VGAAGAPLPEPVDAGMKAMHLLDSDWGIERTVVEGLPGLSGDSPHELAVRSLFCTYRHGPLDAAVEALYNAARCYGMAYPELLDQARKIL